MPAPAASGSPLSGVRVIDLTTVIMGPFATATLADLGADVIKVEALEGDMSRHIGSERNAGMSALTLNLQRNKRSIAVDLTTPVGREVLDDLVRGADVLVTNLRPRSRRNLAITWDRLSQLNRRLIFCHAQAYGSTTARQDFPAYDDIVQAASGMAQLAERVDGRPRYAPYVVADKVVGLYLTVAILSALMHQRSTGEGQEIDVPMVDAMISFNLVEHFGGDTFEPAAGEFGWSRVLVPERVPHRTADGWICIMPYSDANWRDFFEITDNGQLADDPRYRTVNDRHRHMSELLSAVSDVMPSRRTAEWLALCEAKGIPASDLLDLGDATTDPYVAQQGIVVEREHPTEGRYYATTTPVYMSATPVTFRRHAPRLGQDASEILSELGYDAAKIRRLQQDAVVGAPQRDAETC